MVVFVFATQVSVVIAVVFVFDFGSFQYWCFVLLLLFIEFLNLFLANLSIHSCILSNANAKNFTFISKVTDILASHQSLLDHWLCI